MYSTAANNNKNRSTGENDSCHNDNHQHHNHDSNNNNTTSSATVIGDPPPPAIVMASRDEQQQEESSLPTASSSITVRQVSILGSDPQQPAVVEKEEEPPHENDHNDNNNDDDEEEESDYEYEDDDDGHFSGWIIPDQTSYATNAATVASTEQDVVPKESPNEEIRKQSTTSQWKEPSQEAVNMSLRAEKETTGGKRRLASDLYKIMMTDTAEAGFSIKPKSEESLDVWRIRLFQFDPDSNLAQDLVVLGVDAVELEMSFPDQYPFEPPFVRVVSPRFKRQTGFVMNGALCMELLTKDGWNPINDIESVIVSIRSLLVVGDGRLQNAVKIPEHKRQAILESYRKNQTSSNNKKRDRNDEEGLSESNKQSKRGNDGDVDNDAKAGIYTTAEAKAAYDHLSDYHKKKGWDSSGWWAKKG
jgi:ubiquitin-conjugating enzyme E2 Q